MKRIFILLLAIACLSSASNDGFKTTATGLKYKIYTHIEGKKARIGDIITVNMLVRTSTDSLIENSFISGEPIQIKLDKSNFPGDLMEGLGFLTKGDSATILVSSDSIPVGSRPPFLSKAGSYLRFDIKVVGIQTQAEYQAEQAKNAGKQAETDDKLIQDWLKKNGIANAKKTTDGLYYVMDKEGTGAQAKAGDKVSVHYTGTLLNGKKFDSSRDRGQPFSFDLGKGQVIKGWDEGIALFKVGGSGRLIIPSTLAYGPRSMGADIPANSVLVFDIELMGIQ